VEAHYRPVDHETLAVRPGLASPGSLYHYTHGEALLVGPDAERRYIEEILPRKLALDVAYVRSASLWRDLGVIVRTVTTIARIAVGRRPVPPPPEMAAARNLVETPPAEIVPEPPALLTRLGQALREAGIPHCQWKGHWKRAQWATGRGDLDLLVDRHAMPQVLQLLGTLGFRAARPQPGLQLPGTVTLFGFACESGQVLNLHLHDDVVIGEPWRTYYHLPLARAFLGNSVAADPLPLPAAELEYVVFVIRMALRHRLRDVLPAGRRWVHGVQPELAYLERRAEPTRIADALATHLPTVTRALFVAARASLEPDLPPRRALRAARALARAVRAYAQRPAAGARLRLAARHAFTLRGRLGPLAPPRRLIGRGRIVSLVGGDGAGKSTCTRALRTWLGAHLAVTTAHLGRPPRSLMTLSVGAALRLRNAGRRAGALDDPHPRFPGYLALVRALCTARDRYALYARAARFADDGGVALCERHPIEQNRDLVGPVIDRFVDLAPSRWIARRLASLEQRYYSRILPPDLLFVLRVKPEDAVRRKTDEPAAYVHRRATAVWNVDWSGSGAAVIDAGRPLPVVLGNLKTTLWAAL
jgi:hypothetical protein